MNYYDNGVQLEKRRGNGDGFALTVILTAMIGIAMAVVTLIWAMMAR